MTEALMQYEYRVGLRYDDGEQVWHLTGRHREDADKMMELSRTDDDVVAAWLERRPVGEWERLP